MNEMIMDLKSYIEMLRGSLLDEDVINEEVAEMIAAPIGYIKAQSWKKISDILFEIYIL